MLENTVEKGTSLGCVKMYIDILRNDYSEFLTETRTFIGTGKAKDGRHYLALRTTQKDADLTQIEKRIPDDVPYMIEYLPGGFELQDYQKPMIKKSIVIDRKMAGLIMFLTKGDEKKVREFVLKMVEESGALENY